MTRIFLILILLTFSNFLVAQDVFEKARTSMVNGQIKSRGIKDENTLKAFMNVERHKFVPDRLINSSYSDRPLPIGYGQTISQPYIVAYMTEIIQPKPTDKVLEIGTGSGYQAAILAEIIEQVYTIEIIPQLAESAGDLLKELGYKNISVRQGDGYFGWEEHAPFDAIIVTAAAEHIPPPLIEQLKDGGKMIIPVGSPFLTQQLMLVEKDNEKIKTKSMMPVRFVPFTRE